MISRPKKHSLRLRGHNTSVTLEEEFWRAFNAICLESEIGINALASQIDERRGTKCGLASAIRLYVLEYFQNQLKTHEKSSG